MTRMIRLSLVTFAALVLVPFHSSELRAAHAADAQAGQASTDDRGPARPAAVQAGSVVTIVDNDFSPRELTVELGTRVTWVNEGSSVHTATGDGWGTGRLEPGESAAYIFDRPGTFAYRCSYHATMQAFVTVKESSAGPAPSLALERTPGRAYLSPNAYPYLSYPNLYPYPYGGSYPSLYYPSYPYHAHYGFPYRYLDSSGVNGVRYAQPYYPYYLSYPYSSSVSYYDPYASSYYYPGSFGYYFYPHGYYYPYLRY
jgi:plastocyanin